MRTSGWNPPEQGWKIGEKAALQTLDGFCAPSGKGSAIASYAKERNFPALASTSRLSPYLHLGVISPRECAARALAILEQPEEGDSYSGASAWLDEFIWRDFFLHATLHANSQPLVSGAFQSPQREWRDAPVDFVAWTEGKTGYPLVDAAMRELRATGWMHNRCRMVVASFLVKHLLIDWRLGERYFMQQLIDGDVAANRGNWKWVAGVGVDAAPWFRMMNPTLQAQRFDPEGAYIRRWLPEFARLPLKFQVEPFRIQPEEERQFDFHLGVDYPRPMIEHEFARARALRK
jgi:deoxyribodipyrimidine photo-lyase